jgi:hypothetical protein
LNIEALRQLKALRDEGVISEEEFNAKKAELLAAPGALRASDMPQATLGPTSTTSSSAPLSPPAPGGFNVSWANNKVGYVSSAFLLGMFLPWLKGMGAMTGWKAVGFLADEGNALAFLAYLIPVASVFAIYCLVTGREIHKAVRFAGLVPHALLIGSILSIDGKVSRVLKAFFKEILPETLGFGAWWTLIVGVAFFLVAKSNPNLVTGKSQSEPS